MGLFDNISRNIRKLAKLLFWLGIIFTAVYTILIWAQGNEKYSTFMPGLIVLMRARRSFHVVAAAFIACRWLMCLATM